MTWVLDADADIRTLHAHQPLVVNQVEGRSWSLAPSRARRCASGIRWARSPMYRKIEMTSQSGVVAEESPCLGNRAKFLGCTGSPDLYVTPSLPVESSTRAGSVLRRLCF
jgi:hypothetical protein